MTNRFLALGAATLAFIAMAGMQQPRQQPGESDEPKAKAEAKPSPKTTKRTRVMKSDAEWRTVLNEQQYYVTRRKGTEPAFSGQYWNYKGDGIYRCICCETPLFDSRTKFESGTGWPSFFAPLEKSVVKTETDRSNFTVRTEVLCRVCDAHLGHVFRDGPRPTGLRFCMNSASLRFQSRAEAEAEAAAKAILDATPEPDPSAEAEKETPGDEPEPKADEPKPTP